MNFTPAQNQAIQSVGDTLVVAGAGTGKTRTLVERLGRRLLDPDRPLAIDQVLVVTFTEAAAAEVRDRLLHRLEAELTSGSHADLARRQLALLDSAHISTLHSFCYKLVRKHFHQLGLDPLASVVDEGRRRVLRADAFREILDAHHRGLHPHSPEVVDLLNLLFKGDEKLLAKQIWRAHDFLNSIPDKSDWMAAANQDLASPSPTRWAPLLMRTALEWIGHWRQRIDALDVRHHNRDAIAQILAVDPQDLSSLAELLAKLTSLEWPRGTVEKFRKPIVALFDEAGTMRGYLAGEGTSPMEEDWQCSRLAMRPFLSLLKEFGDAFAAAKQARGLLDFSDLEQHALELLWDSTTGLPSLVADSWRRQFEWVLVDEYQDINGAQDRILRAVSRVGDQANRFLVGDMKQSIYRFRQSDPTIFRGYLEQWGEPDSQGQVVYLSENFRSHQGILSFVNDFFARIMRGGRSEIEYDENAALAFGGSGDRAHLAFQSDSNPPVEFLFGELESDPAGGESEDPESDSSMALQSFEREAWMIGQRLLRCLERGETVWDEGAKQWRPARWGDMVVLARAAHGRATHFAKIFNDLGIPILVKQDDFFASGEIRDLRSVLEVLDNPLQDIPLLALLCSPMAGFTHEELATIRVGGRHGRFWEAITKFLTVSGPDSELPLRERLRDFHSRLLSWREARRSESLADQLDSILAETRYLEWVAAQPRAQQRLANIREFLRVARDYDERGNGGLRGFLNHLEDLMEGDPPSEPTALDNSDAVRYMSIHQSKGLEFPIVVVANLENRFRSTDSSEEILYDRDWGLCPKIRPTHLPVIYPSIAHWCLAKGSTIKSTAEEMRILYVAMTRAKSRLILSAMCDREKWARQMDSGGDEAFAAAKSCLDWIGQVLTARHPEWIGINQGRVEEFLWSFRSIPAQVAATGARKPQPSILASEPEAELVGLAQRLAFVYPHDAAVAQFAKTSVSRLRREMVEIGESVDLFKTRGSGDPSEAMEYGSAHHRFLEHCGLGGLSRPEAVLKEADRLLALGYLQPGDRALLDPRAIAAFWGSPLGLELVENAAFVRREVPFTFRLALADLPPHQRALLAALPPGEFVVAQGVADLVVLKPEEIWLVDYKTDRIDPARAAAAAAKYLPQMELYSLALSRIHNLPVKRRLLWYLGPAIPVEL